MCQATYVCWILFSPVWRECSPMKTSLIGEQTCTQTSQRHKCIWLVHSNQKLEERTEVHIHTQTHTHTHTHTHIHFRLCSGCHWWQSLVKNCAGLLSLWNIDIWFEFKWYFEMHHVLEGIYISRFTAMKLPKKVIYDSWRHPLEIWNANNLFWIYS